MQKAQVLTEDPLVSLVPISLCDMRINPCMLWHLLYCIVKICLFIHLAVSSHEPLSTRTIPYLSLLPLGLSILPGNGDLEKYQLLIIHKVSYHECNGTTSMRHTWSSSMTGGEYSKTDIRTIQIQESILVNALRDKIVSFPSAPLSCHIWI